MVYLPYHHDWELAYEADLGLRVHWFGRYAGFPEWKVEKSRVAADMISLLFIEKERCWGTVIGIRMELETGDPVVARGSDEFEYGQPCRQLSNGERVWGRDSRRGVPART